MTVDRVGLTARPFPVTYELVNDLEDPPAFITFLARYLDVVDKHKKPTGEVKLDLLPVRFSGPSRVVAEAKAMAFWDDETAKKRQQQDRGRALGKSRAQT